MIYASVCSGIEAASVAWEPLGWTPAFFAEIDPFASAVLAHRYPGVENLGDFTLIRSDPHGRTIDLLVGGTPCQSFSIAGLRGGLGDGRGNLALEYLRLADRLRPRWLVWENVPGVLSSNEGRDLGAILGGMVELGYGIAWRVLDAQYCRVDGFPRAVPQRRRRLFVVGYLGDWRRAAAVLFERASLLGDSAPRRETGERIAPTISARTKAGGGLGTDFDCDGGLIHDPVAKTLCGREHKGPLPEADLSTVVVTHALRADGFDASEDGTGRGVPLIAFDARQSDVVTYGDRAGPLDTDGTSQAIAFSCKDSGDDVCDGISPTLRAMTGELPNGGGQVAVAIQERAVSENPDAGPDGAGVRDDGAAFTLEARTVPQAVSFAFVQNSRDEVRLVGGDGQSVGALAADHGAKQQHYVSRDWAVRRLTPVECERLQGFPDGWTDVPWRRQPHAPDGPRYKALGNSMAVNCMRWIGRRIAMVEELKCP